ncbi:PREDICTED: diuretic hormone receptor-like, partial [Nicrophorus vespilloides]|uniref:Diuretic hormone receptor-like n=1 Tax=Nicrophorus vespilloides TaxID=110193 RepID=A0ABM1MEA5_NICVS
NVPDLGTQLSILKVLPIFFVIIWAVVKSFLPVTDDSSSTLAEDVGAVNLWTHCPWMRPHWVDWIHQSPTVLVLLLNLVFLASIMWVLITKLRSANTLETQQYRKAAKALLVLMPLLGITYVLTIAGPTSGDSSKMIFDYARAVLLSTQ